MSVNSSTIFLLCIMLCSLSSRYGVQGAGFKAKPFAFIRSLMSTTTSSLYSRSTALNVGVVASTDSTYEGDLLVVPFFKCKSKNDELIADLKANIPKGLNQDIARVISDMLDENNFKADTNSRKVIRFSNSPVKYIALVGLGSSKEYASANIGRTVLDISKDLKVSSAGIASGIVTTRSSDVEELLLGLHDAAYNDERFRKEPEGGHPILSLNSVTLVGVSDSVVASLPSAEKISAAVAAGVHFAKDLVGTHY